MAPVSEAEGQRSGGRWAHRCRRDVLDVLGRVLLHRLRLTAGRGVGQGIVVTVAHGSVVRRPLELNASSNASVGKLRKHPCVLPPCCTRATSRPRLTPLSRACRRLCRSSSTRCRFCSASCASARGATRPATPRSRPRRRPTPRMRLRAGAACVVKQCVVKGGTLRVVWYCVQKREKWTPALALAPNKTKKKRPPER